MCGVSSCAIVLAPIKNDRRRFGTSRDRSEELTTTRVLPDEMSTPTSVRRLLIGNAAVALAFLSSCYGRVDDGSHKEDWPRRLSGLSTEDLETAVRYGARQIDMLGRHEDSLSRADVHVRTGSPTHGQLIDSRPTADGHSASRQAEIVVKASQYIVNKHCSSGSGVSRVRCAAELSRIKLDGTSLGAACASEYGDGGGGDGTACGGATARYRSADGSCNNLKRPRWGRANTAYKRLLFPAYKDGLNSIRELPNPRELSTGLADDRRSPDGGKTIATAFWTVFVGHDLSHTAVSSMLWTNGSVDCCDENGTRHAPRYTHPSCAPVAIPKRDRFFAPLRRTCMNYVRSAPAMRTDCTFGPREQLNQATHYLDASMVYGSSAEQTRSLRGKTGGRLLTYATADEGGAHYMPLTNGSGACQSGDTCYAAGDVRANAQPHLTAVHTLWLREHNRLADRLAAVNRHWDDERTFQEARKIVVAAIQHITYAEWLPALLGKRHAKKNAPELSAGGYGDDVDPTVSNAFATAVLPFANSMFDETLGLYSENRVANKSLSLKEHYNRPSDLQTNYIDHLVRGLSMQNTQKVDMLFTKTVTDYLYSHADGNAYGMDVVSLDIQRGRDHGIPSYTRYRRYCGLSDIRSAQDLARVMVKGSTDRLLKLYGTWDDIDLLVGALSEKHEDGAMVGPTMGCVIREQFTRTRRADRYFYDVPKVFTKHQLAEIRKITLARVFCDNSDNVTSMQQRVFSRPASADDLLPCDSPSIPKINLKHWSDAADKS